MARWYEINGNPMTLYDFRKAFRACSFTMLLALKGTLDSVIQEKQNEQSRV